LGKYPKHFINTSCNYSGSLAADESGGGGESAKYDFFRNQRSIYTVIWLWDFINLFFIV